jgi:serine/threonine protein kinase
LKIGARTDINWWVQLTAGVEPGTLLGDTYRIVRRIGGGGMGEVYEARHERLDHRYAVKLLHPSMRDHPEALPRFMREAQITSRLRHPSIVAVTDFNTLPSGQAYLVMEYLEGESLGQLLGRTGPLPLERVVGITDQLSAALTAAHGQGVVHRDMHPRNVFVLPPSGGERERIKILDFGISKMASVSQTITGVATVLGTPQYMSPEQAEGRTDRLDAASDQFSLGAIVYEMLTGRPAFAGDTLASVAYQIVHGQPVPIRSARPELPPEIEQVVSRALAKKKEDRFRSVAELAVHLRWTATLPPPEVPRAGGDTIESSVVASLEETTAVSELPSGMAAVIRDSGIAAGGTPGPRRTAETIRDDGQPAGVLPRRRRSRGPLVIGGMVAVAVVITLALVLRPRSPSERPTEHPIERGDHASRDEASRAEPRSVEGPAAPSRGEKAGAPVADTRASGTSGAPAALAPDVPLDRRPELSGRPRAAVKPTVPSHRGVVAATGAIPAGAEGVGGTCFATVGSYPWSELWVDGADTGKQTPVVRLPLACGAHRLELRRRDLKIDQVENVTLDGAGEFKHQYELKGAGIDE